MITFILRLVILMTVATWTMATEYPKEGLAKVVFIRCELDAKPSVKSISGNLLHGTYHQEELEMDMLTFYCQVHALFDGDVYLIALRSNNPPKQGVYVPSTLMDEYTLILNTGDPL